MAENSKGSENDAFTNDSFNMRTVEDNLPNVNDSNVNIDCSDDEYADAQDICDNEKFEELDDEALKEQHKDLSDEELEALKEEAMVLKLEGNSFFKESKYDDAVEVYTSALNKCPLKYQNDRAVLFANRAAAKINLDKKEEAVLDCNKAVDLDPNYLKAVLRRAQLHRKLDNLERSLEDYKKVLELDKNNSEARQACATMPAEIEEKNEKLKQEMFGKLKELGNLCLRPFGLSTDNFNLVQDPATGGYSINFQQNKQ